MTFICGRAGVCALGAVIAKHAGDGRLLDNYLRQFKEVLCSIYFLNPDSCGTSTLYMKFSCLIVSHIGIFSLGTD